MSCVEARVLVQEVGRRMAARLSSQPPVRPGRKIFDPAIGRALVQLCFDGGDKPARQTAKFVQGENSYVCFKTKWDPRQGLDISLQRCDDNRDYKGSDQTSILDWAILSAEGEICEWLMSVRQMYNNNLGAQYDLNVFLSADLHEVGRFAHCSYLIGQRHCKSRIKPMPDLDVAGQRVDQFNRYLLATREPRTIAARLIYDGLIFDSLGKLVSFSSLGTTPLTYEQMLLWHGYLMGVATPPEE